jgi:ParB-like chromosome segregation protein Spo0J
MQRQMDVRMIEIDKIRPNPFQPRESFPKEEIQELANTIKSVGLLQPISVRMKGNTYQIISGERRWRAAQFAGLKVIPAIVKDVSDSEMMVESLIENVHRKDLEPLEKARGLAEVYRLNGFDPLKVASKLDTIDHKIRGEGHYKPGMPLNSEEEKIKSIADMVGLSYRTQYELLTQLKLTPEEQKRVSELGLASHKISTIATIDNPEIRKKIIEKAPELKEEEVKKLSKIVKEALEPVVQAVIKPESRLTPKVAEKLLEIRDEKKQKELVKQIESLRLTEEEAAAHVEAAKIELPPASAEEMEKMRQRYEDLKQEIKAKLETPEAKMKGELFKNWTAHIAVAGLYESLSCPICGSKMLGWICHELPIQEAMKMAEEKYKKSRGGMTG